MPRLLLQGRWLRPTLVAALLLLLALVPILTPNQYLVFVAAAALFYSMVALGLNVIVGMAGIWQLAQATFLAVGAYTAGFLARELGVSLWLGIPAGALVAGALGLALALPTMKLRDEYLMIATLNIGVVAQIIMTNWVDVTGGTAGMASIPPMRIPWVTGEGGWRLGLVPAVRPDQQYYIVLGGALLTLLVVWRLERSPLGRALQAMRQDELAAQAMGQDTRRLRMLAFGIGAALAGFAGGIFAARFLAVSPAVASMTNSVLFLAMVIVGGVGSIPGVILGATLLSALPEALRDLERYRPLVYGGILVLMMLVRPQGLLPARMRRLRLPPRRAPQDAAPGAPAPAQQGDSYDVA